MRATGRHRDPAKAAVDLRRRALEARVARARRRLALAIEVERENSATVAELRAYADRLERASPPLVADLRAAASEDLERAEAQLREAEP